MRSVSDAAFIGRCIDFLVGRGFIITDVLHALDWQRPYDGFRSTIGVTDAGLVPKPEKEYNSRYIRPTLVQEHFISHRGDLRAWTGIYQESTRYDVYLNTDEMSSSFYSSATLIHEALHSATLKDDIQLAKQVTGQDFPDTPAGRVAAAAAITTTLADKGCEWRKPGV